jgi:hypothetical protein
MAQLQSPHAGRPHSARAKVRLEMRAPPGAAVARANETLSETAAAPASGRSAMTDLAHAVRPKSVLVAEVTGLLRRYPELGRAETRRLIEGFRKLPILEAALLTTDDQLRPRLDAFRRDHKWAIRPPLWHYLLGLVVPVTLAAVFGWGLWQAAVGG